ncbi:MAG TPA: phosphatidylcholine/phosphatidylserine synthase [Blastocatellia bacterium]|nr:phosphatidylcholine/phosphatidylserine synthase [Blastocatellia bacterium]
MADRSNNEASEEIRERRLRRRFRKGVFVIPSLFTTANIFCGFYSVMESLAGVHWLSLERVDLATDHFDRAAINIGFAWLFDILDGRLARMTRATSEFGLELDSIADVLSFGIAPAVLAYSWGYGQFPEFHKLAWGASFFYVICGSLRLARFNVQARQPSPNLPPKNPKIEKKAFVGMPIPSGAGLIAAIAHFSPAPVKYAVGYHFSVAGRTVALNGRVFAIALLALVTLLALLMVSTIRYTSFKHAGARNYHPRVLILALALVVLAVWFYSQWSLLIISTAYVSHGLLGKLWSMVKHRRGGIERPEKDIVIDGAADFGPEPHP